MAFLESQKWTYLGLVEGQKLKSFSTETTCRQLAEKKSGESRHQWNTRKLSELTFPCLFLCQVIFVQPACQCTL